MSVAGGLKLSEPDGLVALVGLFYAAVDLSDDVVDGDAAPEAVGDPERLLLWLPEAAHVLDPTRGPAALRTLHRGGLAMWEGQDLDLSARGRVLSPAEALTVAEGKAGEEIAAVFAAVAEAAGVSVSPWEALGRAMGVALQLVTDLADFSSGARDWDARQPTWPLAVAFAHPVWGPGLRHAWAGEHRTETRRARGWSLVVAAHDAETVDALGSRIDGLARDLPAQDAVRPMLETMERWRSPSPAVELVGMDPEPGASHEQALVAATAFLRRDPGLEEAIERHERPLWGRPRVEAPLFGRLLAAWAAREAGVELGVAWAALSTVPAHGYRYFPELPEVALDIDLAGWLLTAQAGPAEELKRKLEEAVPLDLPTWLGPAVGPDGVPFSPHACVASMASAARGLHRAGSALAEEAWDRTLRTRRILGPASPYYEPLTVDALLVDGAVECGLDADALGPSLALLAGAARISGLLGDLWSTAVATPALLCLERHPTPLASHRALVDGLRSDGGAPAAGWRTIPREGQETWFRSRALSTAFVLRALHSTRNPPFPLAPAPEAVPLRVADV